MTCPSCSSPIAADDINVPADTALCRQCGEAVAFSSLVPRSLNSTEPREVEPPPGAWRTDDGVETRIGASTRSPIAFFLVPFVFIWSGFSIGGIYGSQIISGKLSPMMSLFGIPFLIGTLLFGMVAAMTVAGKVVVRLRGDDGRIFTGLGAIGWVRRFKLSDFNRISESVSTFSGDGHVRRCIVLEGTRRFAFGSVLNESRRYFVLESLRPMLRA